MTIGEGLTGWEEARVQQEWEGKERIVGGENDQMHSIHLCTYQMIQFRKKGKHCILLERHSTFEYVAKALSKNQGQGVSFILEPCIASTEFALW